MELQIHKYLDSLGIKYEKKEFSTDTEKGAANVAKELRLTETQTVKTLIFEDRKSGEHILVMVGGDQNAISGHLKKAIGSRDIRMASPEKVKEVTGYVIGSIPPVGWQEEGFRSFIEASLLKERVLGVGTGEWGHEVLISPNDLISAIDNITVVNLIDKDQEIFLTESIVDDQPIDEIFSERDIEIPHPDKITRISELSSKIGETIILAGWIYNKRSSGGVEFLQFRDGTGFIQSVVEKDLVDEESWTDSSEVTIESSCLIEGKVVEEPRSPEGMEIKVSKFQIIRLSPEFPIGKKEHGPEFLFDNRDLYLRSKTPWAVLRIRNQVFLSITNFFAEEGFIRTDTPILQPTSCEDTTQLFSVDYFGESMYLSQSGQLYSEAAIMGLSKVYDFGPVFRAEKSKTRNHLSEFWMMDAEMAFYDQSMNMDVQERLVKRILKDALDFCKTELEILERDTTIIEQCVAEPFIRMKHYDAKKELEMDGFKVDFDDDMTTEEEIALGNKYKKPVFIEDYPFEVKSFYMKSYVDERGMKRARCADLIAPEEAREIIGGSQREDSYNTLRQEIKNRNYPLSEYEWYLNIRKYGSVPHSGFGIGMERMVRWISGVHHIRESIPFPRTMARMRP